MTNYRKVPLALIAGAAVGALVLGIAGRAAMTGIALLAGSSLNTSMRGLFEVMLFGAVLGAVGGAMLVPVRKVLQASRLARGTVVGVLLFAGSCVVSFFRGQIGFGFRAILPVTLAMAAAMFIVYGVSLDALLTRLEGNARQTGQAKRL
jgi:hypothetical protein